jgi:glycosyltransferase involved in cell wall biosynthesis
MCFRTFISGRSFNRSLSVKEVLPAKLYAKPIVNRADPRALDYEGGTPGEPIGLQPNGWERDLPMRIGITTFGGDGGKSGISRYIIKLLEQFAMMDDGPEWEVVVYEEEQSIFLPPSERMSPYCCGKGLHNPVLNVAWHQVALPLLCRSRGYDAVFLPAANRRLPFWVPCPSIGTVHDFSGIHVAEKYDPARMFFIKSVTPFLTRRLSMVLTVSESSKRDIVEVCGIPEDRVKVTPNGVDLEVFRPQVREETVTRVQDRYGLRTPYILYVSRIEHPGKNHKRLIEAFNRLKSRTGCPHSLAFIGSPWSRAEEVFRAAEQSPFAGDITFVGFADGADLPALYGAADLFAFPSLYEGFGMPILEAMACGTPVVCSNLSSMPEVAGDAALLFDPYHEEDMCHVMERMLQDAALRQQCVDRGLARCKEYSWARTAALTLDAIRHTVEAQS